MCISETERSHAVPQHATPTVDAWNDVLGTERICQFKLYTKLDFEFAENCDITTDLTSVDHASLVSSTSALPSSCSARRRQRRRGSG